MKNKKLYRDTDNKMWGGVLSGIAVYFDIDVTILRLLYVFIAIFTSGIPFLILYIVAQWIIPTKEELQYKEVQEAEFTEKECNDNTKSESIFDEEK